MIRQPDRKLILEDGQEYCGYSFGSVQDRVLEIVFNTSMAGYQEILSDPSYTDQAVVMTYPLIGNYGMAEDDYESAHPSVGAMIVREYNDEPSCFRSKNTLGEIMERFKIAGISGLDTRRLTRSIRDFGSRRVLITDIGTPRRKVFEDRGNESPDGCRSQGELQQDLLCRTAGGTFSCSGDRLRDEGKHCSFTGCERCESQYRAVEYGCGNDHEACPGRNFHIQWSGRPGKCSGDNPYHPFTYRKISCFRDLSRTSDHGACIWSAKTYKAEIRARGGNHPVMDLETGRIEITSQNHSYAVDEESLKGTPLEVTHINLLDHTVEGQKCEKDRAFSVQYHPESSPGPQESAYLFDRFISMMEGA